MPTDQATIDGLQAGTPPTNDQMKQKKNVRAWKTRLVLGATIPTLLYIGWCGILLLLLPSTDPRLAPLTQFALLSVVVGGSLTLIVAFITLLHILQSKSSSKGRIRALAILTFISIPGVVISAITGVLILRAPPIALEVVSPASQEELVAPVQMVFSIEDALPLLRSQEFVPQQYKWDINNDKKVDQTTLIPTLTATFEREGIYAVSVTMLSAANELRTATKRFVIHSAVFTLIPPQPIVSQPVTLSLASQFPDLKTFVQAQWDFDGDGKIDDTTESPEVTHTYFETGTYTVRVLVDLANKTQMSVERVIAVAEPAPLPFPISIRSEPRLLVGVAPFSVLFNIETAEDIAAVSWDFGDGEKNDGLARKVAHTYAKNGSYVLRVGVRTASGITAVLSPIVQVVDQLKLPDLTFEGTPKVSGRKIQGEVPLTLSLVPRTQLQFIQFSWEAPDATEVTSTENALHAIYREPGNFVVTLIARDANGKVLREPMEVTVIPAKEVIEFQMDPETGIAPLAVNFDASETYLPTDDLTGFVWNFGDGTPEITKGATVTHTYEKPKTYTVLLKVQTVSGKTYQAKKTLVVRASALQACFTRSREIIRVGDPVSFDPGCTAGVPTSYLWDFGDATQNDAARPIHTFQKAGDIVLSLSIKDATGNTNTFRLPLTIRP